MVGGSYLLTVGSDKCLLNSAAAVLFGAAEQG